MYLNDYEHNGEMVETVYSILEYYTQFAFGDPTHPNIKMMEKSKLLLTLGIRHTGIFFLF